ncbi:MAG: sugar transferase [Myxococcales bacterium]|nr:sugar transferase [Myxococcales bacterium]
MRRGTRRFQELGKRLVDVGLTLAALPGAAAILTIAGLAVAWESPGGVVFRQQRIGRGGRPFTVYKLRTMVANAERLGAGIYNEADDPRFTAVGKLLRRTSLDELPQLVNVLRGEMSLVGPRPQLPVIVEQYADDYAVILAVKPGLTGLAQVNGRNELPRSRRLALDRAYAEDWSLGQDLKIILKTVGVVLRGEGQRNDQSRADVER